MKKLVVLTGAGISAESGIKTFRDSNGLWEGHDVMEVASPMGWTNNPNLVLDFYNKRRQQLHQVQPNQGHLHLAELEKYFDVQIITQNVDNLHEKAGSSNILHLHGELLKVRSTQNPDYILDWEHDLNIGDFDLNGHQMRPHIVWFGEEVPAIEEAILLCEQADYLAIIGTSLQVYPAARLLRYAPKSTPLFYIDPKPFDLQSIENQVTIITKNASEGVADLKELLLSK